MGVKQEHGRLETRGVFSKKVQIELEVHALPKASVESWKRIAARGTDHRVLHAVQIQPDRRAVKVEVRDGMIPRVSFVPPALELLTE